MRKHGSLNFLGIEGRFLNGQCSGFTFPFSFRRCGRVAGGGVEAEDAEIAGGLADFGQGEVELRGGVGFDVEEELVFPGTTVDGAAFDFLEVDAVFGEGLERSKERAGAVGEAHGEGHFAGVRSGRWGFGGGAKEYEAREIFGVVLDVGGEDDAGVVLGGAGAGDGGAGFVAASQGFTDAAGGVFGGNAFEVGMSDEEAFTLGQRHGMTCDGAEVAKCGAGAAY